MGTLEQRIAALEQRIVVNNNEWRPLPFSFFYGEPLPDDFYTYMDAHFCQAFNRQF